MKKIVVWVAVAAVSFAALCLFVGMGVKNTAISYEESIENAKGDIRNA